jgi:hypothetical protein
LLKPANPTFCSEWAVPGIACGLWRGHLEAAVLRASRHLRLIRSGRVDHHGCLLSISSSTAYESLYSPHYPTPLDCDHSSFQQPWRALLARASSTMSSTSMRAISRNNLSSYYAQEGSTNSSNKPDPPDHLHLTSHPGHLHTTHMPPILHNPQSHPVHARHNTNRQPTPTSEVTLSSLHLHRTAPR